MTDDLCVIIRSAIEDFGVARCQQIEEHLDKTLVPLGFTRTGSDKTESQIYLHYRCFGVALADES